MLSTVLRAQGANMISSKGSLLMDLASQPLLKLAMRVNLCSLRKYIMFAIHPLFDSALMATQGGAISANMTNRNVGKLTEYDLLAANSAKEGNRSKTRARLSSLSKARIRLSGA